MSKATDEQAIRAVIVDYLEGMIYGDDGQLRSAMHPLCMQAGHMGERYEFIPRDEFIEALRQEKRLPKGTPFRWEVNHLEITGDIALAKVTDDCFGTTWTDYLTFIRHGGRWQIVMKAFVDHTAL
ncbi:MAG: nuclear transport factor 2 family protein [Aestuariivirga sp.]